MPGMDPIKILMDDHRKFEELFARFEATEDAKQKGQIGDEIVNALTIHTKVEEELFYPPLHKTDELRDIINESIKEHDVAEMLIADSKKLSSGNEMYEATFTTLKEAVEHHVVEEEEEMFPKAKELLGSMGALGQKMWDRKQELMGQTNKKSQTTSSGSRSRASSGSNRSRSTSKAGSKAGSGSRSR